MVVWQGITEGGVAVPVEVKEDGKVVAEGLQGPPGPEGPEGPQGPEGPPGNPNLRSLKRKALYGAAKAAGSVRANGAFVGFGCTVSKTERYDGVTVGNSDGVYYITFNEPLASANYGFTSALATSSYADAVIIDKDARGCKIYVTYKATNSTGVLLIDYPFDFAIYDDQPVTVGSADGPDGIDDSGNLIVTGTATFADNKLRVNDAGELIFSSRGNQYTLTVQGELCIAIPYDESATGSVSVD